MPQYAVINGERFIGDFSFAPAAGHIPAGAEEEFLATVLFLIEELAAEEPAHPELRLELEKLRTDEAALLRSYADQLVAAPPGDERQELAATLTRKALRIDGGYMERRKRILRQPFIVDLHRRAAGGPATDLIIKTRDVPIPADKQALKVEIDKVLTVMFAVFGLGPDRGGAANTPEESSRAWKLSNYLESLSGIADIGLSGEDRTQTPFATLALAAFKDDFLAREGGRIKNAYVLRLGGWALLALSLCVVVYGVMQAGWYGLPAQANFLLLWIGAALGAWASFTIRKVILTFGDLAALEEDRLRPEFRIAFVLVLTTIVGLLFWTEMVTITVGKFTTDFAKEGSRDVAILIGVFCGLAERSLSGAVVRRAEDFAVAVGGQKKV